MLAYAVERPAEGRLLQRFATPCAKRRSSANHELRLRRIRQSPVDKGPPAALPPTPAGYPFWSIPSIACQRRKSIGSQRRPSLTLPGDSNERVLKLRHVAP